MIIAVIVAIVGPAVAVYGVIGIQWLVRDRHLARTTLTLVA